MAIQIRYIGALLLTLGTGCVDDPLPSSPASGPLPPPGGPTSFDPNPMTGSTGSTGLPTTGEPATGTTTSATTSGSTAADGKCGDGVVDPGEECDLGAMNASKGACTLECKHAVCGDGLVQEIVGEQCDFGLGNSDAYGGCSPDTCQWGPRCGDGIVDTPNESCDRAELNGSGMTPDEFAPCSLMCGFMGRVIFVTNELYNGDLGGVSGGDLKCRTAAAAAGLPKPGGYRVWLSDEGQSPISRFNQWSLTGVPLMLVDGRIVADDLLDLADNGPRIGISLTELHEPIFDWRVWTNTSAAGEVFSVTHHCLAWSSADGVNVARQGRNALVDEDGPEWQAWRDQRWWTSYLSQFCNKTARLYCIDDGFAPEE